MMTIPNSGQRIVPDALRIGIIGLGPRGLTVLERAIAFSRERRDVLVEVLIFEPNEPGCGTHPKRQPDYLKLNTVACQISMFPGDVSSEEQEPHVGPSLFEWCIARDLTVEDDHAPPPRPKRPVRPTDFLPRRLLGEYLVWFYNYLMTLVPSNLMVALRPVRAIDIRQCEAIGRFRIFADDGGVQSVDYVFITIGHPSASPAAPVRPPPRLTQFAYPLPESVEDVGDGAAITINGLGLTAMDIMVALIDKWGGRFARACDGALRYCRSGREGRLRFVTCNGRPYCARPAISVAREARRATFLTWREVDRRLRAAREDGESWFTKSILPLMRLEMIVAYYACCAAQSTRCADDLTPLAIGPLVKAAWMSDLLTPSLERLAAAFGRFDPDVHLALRAPADLDAEGHRQWFRAYASHDVTEARRGLARSPLKAALEVWRDLRDTLRAIVDDCRFTVAAREGFFRDYVPMINRLVAGPQWERAAEFVCLMNEGIAELRVSARAGLEHDPRCGGVRRAGHPAVEPGDAAEWTINAYLQPSGAKRADTALFGNLVARQIITHLDGVASVDGIQVTAAGTAVGPNSAVTDGVWIFGPAAEGATYYNHYVPAAGGRSRAYLDSHRAVKTCFDDMATHSVRRSEPIRMRRAASAGSHAPRNRAARHHGVP